MRWMVDVGSSLVAALARDDKEGKRARDDKECRARDKKESACVR